MTLPDEMCDQAPLLSLQRGQVECGVRRNGLGGAEWFAHEDIGGRVDVVHGVVAQLPTTVAAPTLTRPPGVTAQLCASPALIAAMPEERPMTLTGSKLSRVVSSPN